MHSASATIAINLSASASGTRFGLPIPEDAPVEEQLRLLVRRITTIEEEVVEDRRRLDNDLRRVRDETSKVKADLNAEVQRVDRSVDTRIASLATSSVRLQIVGLLMVGVGSILTAAPTVLSAAAAV